MFLGNWGTVHPSCNPVTVFMYTLNATDILLQLELPTVHDSANGRNGD